MEICRYMPNAERVDLWQRTLGPVPEGMRIGSICSVAYCGNLGHMVLAENINHKKTNWKPLVERILSLSDGESFDLLDFPHAQVTKMRAAVGMSLGCVHIITRNIPGSREGVKIIRAGDFYGDKREWERQFPILDKRVSSIRPWQRPCVIWLGMDFTAKKQVVKPSKCSVRNCPMPIFRGVGDYCYQHNHWFDFGMTMHDTQLDRSRLFNPREPHSGYELAAERLLSMAALERSLRVSRSGFLHDDHRNAGAEQTKTKVALPNYSRSPSRLRMRLGGGSHSSSKTTRGKAKAASRQGKGSRHSTKQKRWNRETIESLEQQANAILGEVPIDQEYNFIPEAEREDGEIYEVPDEDERTNAIEALWDKKNEFEQLFGV